MIALKVRPGSQEEDARRERRWLSAELKHPNRILLVIRGGSPDILRFLDRAEHLTQNVPWRETVWIADDQILSLEQKLAWFENDPGICAAIFNFSGDLVGTLRPECSSYDLEMMLLDAMRSSKRPTRSTMTAFS